MALTGIECIEDGFYYDNKDCIGDMVLWDNQNIKVRGQTLKRTKITSIAFGTDKDELRITYVTQLIKEAELNIGTIKRIKTRI